jgi:diaminopimelate decarboxylase
LKFQLTTAIVVGISDDFEEEESVQEEVVQQPFTEVVEETVEALNHTGGSHVSYVTTESQSPQNTVIQAAKDEVQEEDSDSD